MRVLPYSLDQINEIHLQQLLAEGWVESQTLDFKRELPGRDDKAKLELLKDVSALANRDGGDLIYGIDDKEGSAVKLAPINSEPADAAKRRIAQVLDSGIEPRVPGLQIREVLVAGGYVLIVRVPSSFDGPHRHSNGPWSRFVLRNHTTTTDMTYEQLRTAFDRTATLAERARQFRDERVNALKNQQTSVRVQPGPLCVVHLVPVASMAGRHSINIAELHDDFVGLEFKEWRGASCKINLDGLLIHPIGIAEQDGALAYVQVFRTGVFEAVRVGGGMVDPGRKLIPSTVVSGFFHDALGKLLTRARLFGITGPAVAGIALLFVADYKFGMHEAYFDMTRATADERQHLVLPEVWVNSLESARTDEIARPLLDILWQAFDLPRCSEYSEDGAWAPRRQT